MKGQFNKRQGKLAFNCFYVPAMVYCLTAVNLEKDQ
jgi:hypothetical protein